MELRKCYACQEHTQTRCSYCLLPICGMHGSWLTPWYITQPVLVCAHCRTRLLEIAQEEEPYLAAAPISYYVSPWVLLPRENVMGR